MALYVNTNVTSLNAQRKLSNATNSLNTCYQRLSSGLRINSARDDAAGLQISDRLTAQINGLKQGNRNTNDGIALCQTVEGALDETTNMLQRIRTLAVQSANGTYSDADRQAIQEEVTQLSREITRIAKKTTFAGAQVLDGMGPAGAVPAQPNLIPPTGSPHQGEVMIQVGANADDTIGINLATGFTVSSMADDPRVNTPVASVPDPKKDFKLPTGTDLKATKMPDSLSGYWEHMNPAFTGLVVTAQKLPAPDPNVDTSTDTAGNYQEARWSISTAAFAQITLANIDKVISYVDSKRAELGAMQNRMEATIRNQSSIIENESDARSRIRDTDFAEETARMTQLNIIQNASQTILAQANQRPQIALQLLSQ